MAKHKKINLEYLVEDYATKPVARDISVSGLRIAMINTALAFSLPALLTGVQLSSALDADKAITAIIWGGVIVTLIGTVAGMVGLRNRLSTYMLIRFSFGARGSVLVNLCMALSMFGWFGVNVYLFGQAAGGLFQSLTGIEAAHWIFLLAGGLLMTAGAIFGFKSVQKLALLIVPVQVLVLAILLNNTFAGTSIRELLSLPAQTRLTQGEAISAVVGSFIVAAVIMPDFTRYGRKWQDSFLASFIPYFIATTFSYSIALFAALWTGKDDIIQLMLTAGLGIFAFILVILSSWITNSVNLYGCSLSLSSIFTRFQEWKIAIASGIAGTTIAFFEILEHFIDFIFSLGIIFTPIAGIYSIDYFILNRANYNLQTDHQNTRTSYIALVSWLSGIVVAYGAIRDLIHITGIASCDSLFAAALTYLVLMTLKKRFNTSAKNYLPG